MPSTIPAPARDVDLLITTSAHFLLRNSAEGTFDLESNLRQIGEVYGAEVAALVNMEGLVVVITHDDGSERTCVVHAEPSLERLDQLSQFKVLSQRIEAGELSAAEAVVQLQALQQTPDPYPWWLRLLGVALFAAGFAPSMQATWGELGAALLLGTVTAVCFLVAERLHALRVLLPLLAAVAVSVVAFTCLDVTHAHGGPVLVMVPALFVLIPGDFLCAAAAEVAIGHLTVGTIRLAQSVFILLQLAGGVIIGAAVSGVGTHALIQGSTTSNLPWVLVVLAWIPFTIGLSLTFCARLRDAWWIGLFVYVAWGVQLGGTWLIGDAGGTFLAAAVLCAAGTILGHHPRRPPSLIIIIGGVFVLTVGSMALRGLTTLAGGDVVTSFHDMGTFCRVAGSLTFGLIVGTAAGIAWLRRRDADVAVAVDALR